MLNTHREHHFTASNLVRDMIIGLSDGLTVPFAIAAGMTGAAVATRVIVIAGLAEIAAGSISMGLGGFLAAKSDIEHYDVERQREVLETHTVPDQEAQEVLDILESLGLPEERSQPIVDALRRQRDKWVDFMMQFELGLERPDPQRTWKSALTIALSYTLSGFIPLSPYMILPDVQTALHISVLMTLAALFTFGFVKGRITGVKALRSAVQMILIGGAAAGAAFGLASWLG